MNITIPEFALVVLVGASGSGKSTFAKTHFLPTEIVSPDFCRGLVSDDENNQEATKDAFDVLHYIASKRLTRMKLTVVDATNV
jgi:protein phosphatase